MSLACTINPSVEDVSGNPTDSLLFKELRQKVDYQKARKAWLISRSVAFEEAHSEDNIERDENGEPTYDALVKLPEFEFLLGTDSELEHAEANAKLPQPKVATRSNIDAADEKAMQYNSSASASGKFVAVAETFVDDDGIEKVSVSLKSNTAENRELAQQSRRKIRLNQRLREILAKWGVSVGTLNDLEEKFRINGVTDFQAAVMTADGMTELIRLSKNEAGEYALPEEFSHLVLEALKDSQIVSRLKNVIKANNLARIILGEELYAEYAEDLKNNQDLLAEEAMGHLVARHILAQAGIDTEDSAEYASARTLISRLKEQFNSTFSKFDEDEIFRALQEAEELSGEFSKGIMEGALQNEVRLESISSTKVFHQLQSKAEMQAKKQKKLLTDLIEQSSRRFEILRNKSKEYDKDAERSTVLTMQTRLEQKDYELGVCEFISDSLEQLRNIDKQLQYIQDHPEMPINRRAAMLKNAKDFIMSYATSLSAIRTADNNGEISPTMETKQTLREATDLVGQLTDYYERLKAPIVISYVKGFIGEGIEVPYGKMKGHKYTAEELCEMAEKDIGIFDRLLDSMAESGDWLLRMLDATAKEARGKARLATLEVKARIDAADAALKKAGVKDYDFMFEKDKDGNLTGNYITRDQAMALPLAQRNYFFEMMSIKKMLDNMLPDGTTSLRDAIRINKSRMEQIRKSGSAKEMLEHVKDGFRDKLYRTSHDEEFGNTSVLLDFEGNKVDMLPIYYIKRNYTTLKEDIDNEIAKLDKTDPNYETKKSKLEGQKAKLERENDPNMLSTDVSSTMLMYAQMANNFNQMNDVIGILELMREKIRERPVQQRTGNKALKNVLNVFGLRIEDNYTKTGEATNIVRRMNDWFSSQVYGKYMKDEGEVFGMDVAKLANAVNEVTALNQFALNIMSGISNVMTGSAMMNIEAACGEFYSAKDLANASKIFWGQIPAYIADIGNPVKSSKLALWNEKFNTLLDFESDMREQQYGKTRAGRLFQSNSLYFINSSGELWLQSRNMLANALSTKLKDAHGNEISLWDAYTVVEKNGIKSLELQAGVTKLDGSKFEDSDIIKFTNKVKAINQRLNGIYNYEDRCAAQAYSWGRMGLMFRKWIKISLNRRYGSLKYNFDLENWEEGFYRAAGRFFTQVAKDLKKGQLHLAMHYKSLTPQERQNITRFGIECAQFMLVVLSFGTLTKIKKAHDDDPDEDNFTKTWWFSQLRYQTRRLQSEIGAQMIFNPQIVQEAFNILKSPAASVNTFEGFLNLSKLAIPKNWTTEIQSGKYKGHTRAYKLFWDSPIIPIRRTIYRGIHPQDSIQYYDQ